MYTLFLRDNIILDLSVPSPSTYFSKIYFFNFYMVISNPHMKYLGDVSRLFSQPAKSYNKRLSHRGGK